MRPPLPRHWRHVKALGWATLAAALVLLLLTLDAHHASRWHLVYAWAIPVAPAWTVYELTRRYDGARGFAAITGTAASAWFLYYATRGLSFVALLLLAGGALFAWLALVRLISTERIPR